MHKSATIRTLQNGGKLRAIVLVDSCEKVEELLWFLLKKKEQFESSFKAILVIKEFSSCYSPTLELNWRNILLVNLNASW